MASDVEKNSLGTQVFKTRVPPFYFPSSSSSPSSVCSFPARSPNQRLFILLRRYRFEDLIVHPASVLLQPNRLPLFFEDLDRFPLPLFFFRFADHLLALFFFVSGFGLVLWNLSLRNSSSMWIYCSTSVVQTRVFRA